MDDLIVEAKECLIRARSLRQEAQHIEGLDALYNPSGAFDNMSGKMRDRAQHYRLRAKEQLKTLERINGSRYLMGKDMLALRKHLAGRQFRLWHCYKDIYKSSDLFRGVDPQ